MSAIWARKISVYILIILLCAPIGIASSTVPMAPSPILDFRRSNTSFDYIGSLSGSGHRNLEDVRITLYDQYKQPIETGLLSEYSQNSSYGYFLGFRDNNINGRLDGADSFYVYEQGEVLPSWGIFLTYEKTGRTLTSSTISGKDFSIEDKKEPDNRMLIRYTVLILMIFNLLIILTVVYKMPCF